MQCVTFLLCLLAVSAEDNLTKVWTISSLSDGSVFNSTSPALVIQPSKYADQSRSAHLLRRYAFKPRAIPIPREQSRPETVYYTNDANKYKSDMLFPGNFYSISKEKSNGTDEQFKPQTIPLIRNEEIQRRSMDTLKEDIDSVVQGRSIGEMFGEEDDDDDDDRDYEIEEAEDAESKHKNKIKKPKLKPKKLKKYYLPLLLAYKLKYAALIPVAVAGLVLLVGATGLAGFFFALFAAVMGLQKGGY